MSITSVRPASDSLACLKQVSGSAAQNQELCRQWITVSEDSKNLEYLRGSLYFVDHHKSLPVAKSGHGLGKQRFDFRLFEVEIILGFGTEKHAGKCCLARLARPYQDDDTRAIKSSGNGAVEAETFDLGRYGTLLTLKIEISTFDFQGEIISPER